MPIDLDIRWLTGRDSVVVQHLQRTHGNGPVALVVGAVVVGVIDGDRQAVVGGAQFRRQPVAHLRIGEGGKRPHTGRKLSGDLGMRQRRAQVSAIIGRVADGHRADTERGVGDIVRAAVIGGFGGGCAALHTLDGTALAPAAGIEQRQHDAQWGGRRHLGQLAVIHPVGQVGEHGASVGVGQHGVAVDEQVATRTIAGQAEIHLRNAPVGTRNAPVALHIGQANIIIHKGHVAEAGVRQLEGVHVVAAGVLPVVILVPNGNNANFVGDVFVVIEERGGLRLRNLPLHGGIRLIGGIHIGGVYPGQPAIGAEETGHGVRDR